MRRMVTGFIAIDSSESMVVLGGTDEEESARALGRLIGFLVGTLQKLFGNSN